MPYLYGTYGAIVQSVANLGETVGTVAAYIGTAPVHLVKNYKGKDLVNHPVKIKNLTDAKANIGYCSDWTNYSLCEAIAAHFDNGGTSVGPIYMINVLDPAKNKAGSVSDTLSFANARAFIPGSEIIVDSLKIARPVPEDIAQLPAQAIEFRGKGTGKDDKNFDYAKAYKEAGLTIEGTTVKYVPTGKIDEKLYRKDDGKAYFGLKFTKPEGATKVTVKLNGETIDEKIDLTKDGPFVSGGELIEYIWFDDNGKPRGDDFLAFECEWEGGQTPKTGVFATTDNGAYYELEKDYDVEYNVNRNGLIIQAISEDMPASTTVTYDTIDPTNIDADDVIGGETENGYLSGIAAVKLLFMEYGAIPNILAAPGWSDKLEVCEALSAACRQMNGHWDSMYLVDIPLEDDGEKVDTIRAALAWKKSHFTARQPGAENSQPYNDERSKVCWPQAQDAKGRVYHLSTLFVVQMLKTDQENNNVPYETAANKAVPVIRQYFGPDSMNNGFDQRESDALCSKGISTIIPWSGSWVTWGHHTASYDMDDDELDPRAIFDVSMRMLMYVTNSFQKEWAQTIDEPVTRSLVDTIINREQEKLDQLVSMGALVGKPTITFSDEDNSALDMKNGHFTWQMQVTPTPPLASATVKIAYTDEGFTSYWGEE